MDAYYIDASVAPYYYAKPHQAAMTAPHLISQRRMQELVAPESSSSSSAPSSSSSSSPVSSLPTVLTVSEIEEKLANALIACRAALHVSEEDALESEVSTDDGSDEDMDDDDEFSSEDDSMLDADEDDVDDDDEEEEDLAPVRPDDTYERRMRRVSAWRDTVAAEAPAALSPASPAPSRKRKADGDCETTQSACAKRARIALDALPATCAACGGVFPSALALQLHGLPMNPSEACRAAVAYQLEA